MKEVKLIIPDNWNDITIGTYQEQVKIQESKKGEKHKIVRSLALLCNTSPFVVKKMAYKDFQLNWRLARSTAEISSRYLAFIFLMIRKPTEK